MKYITAALLFIICLLVVACSSKSGSNNTVAIANPSSFSSPTPKPTPSMEEKAKAEVKQQLEPGFAKCGNSDSYYFQDFFIFEHKDPTYVVESVDPITEIDRLNGITWKGKITYRYTASRKYIDGVWSDWSPYTPLAMYVFPVIVKNSALIVENTHLFNGAHYKIDCQRIGLNEGDAKDTDETGQSFSVKPIKYANAKWDEYGVGYDGVDTQHVIYIWMRAKGNITYNIPISQLNSERAIISAKLSSELKTANSNPESTSDVTLIVNGEKQAIQTVIADNGRGAKYQWEIPTALLRAGDNEITFKVGEGTHNNGLCIYSPIQIKLE